MQVYVRLLHERRYDPPRPVEVEHKGQWCPGLQSRWLLCDDDRGWMAQVEYTAQHEWVAAGPWSPCRQSAFGWPTDPVGRASTACQQACDVIAYRFSGASTEARGVSSLRHGFFPMSSTRGRLIPTATSA